MEHKYGYFSENQISEIKKQIQKSIFFLLILCDPNTKDKYNDVDANEVFHNLLFKISGLNEILFNPPELVTVISLLEMALCEYNSYNFKFGTYRKLVLDAGAEIMKIDEVADND